MNRVILSPEYFPNPTIGRPISNADIYVGIVDLDPTVLANQKQISVQQESGTIVAVTQPVSTGAGGVPLYLGSPVTILVDGNYSLKVLDKLGAQVYYVPSQADFTEVNEVSDMLGLINATGRFDGDVANMLGFFVTFPQSSFRGSGRFAWQADANKNLANGGTIIDPANTGGFDGTTATLAAFLSAQGGGVGTGCWVRVGIDIDFSIFGAKGDNSADDTVSINATLQEAIATNSKVVPSPGIYRQTAAINLALTGEQKLEIHGPGAGAVEWRMDTAGNGLNITCAGNWWLSDTAEGNNTLWFSGLDFSTNNGVAGVGINITGSSVAGRPAIGTKFNDCTFRGHSGAGQFWATAVTITDMQNATFSQCYFFMDSTARTSNGVSLAGATVAESPTSYHFTDCEFFYGNTCVESGDFVEGLYVVNSSFVSTNRGIYYHPVSAESGLQVTNCHFNTRFFSIELENVFDFDITGNLFFSSIKNAAQGSILGDVVGRFNITGNTFVATGGTDIEYGVVIAESPDSDELGGGLIDSNSFYKYSFAGSAPIWLGALARRVDVGRNFYSGDCVDRVLVVFPGENIVDKRTYSGTVVKTLAGGASFETVTFAIPVRMFIDKPESVIIQGTEGFAINGSYMYSTGTATSVDVVVTRVDGVNLTNAAFRFSFIMEGE